MTERSASPVAVVTGAARGIGLAIARRLSNDGASVVMADVDLAAVSDASRQVASSVPLHLDVSDPASVQSAFAAVLERFERVDILVNNAGIAGMAAPVSEYPFAEWRRILSVNLDGVFLCMQAVIPGMVERGSGRIVNIASISGKEGNPNMSAYSSSKGGVITLTKAAAKELATTGVIVNCVTPAVIQSDILDQLTQEAVDYMVSKIPMGRTGQPEEVAALVAWLVSPECTFSTGAVFDISGGRATY